LDLKLPTVGSAQNSPQVSQSPAAAPWRGAAGIAVVGGDNEAMSLDQVQKKPPPAGPQEKQQDLYGYWEPGVIFKNLNREQAEEQLKGWGPGTYLIRPSSQKHCMSCTYRVGVGQPDAGRIGHLLLLKPSSSVPGWTTDGRPMPYKTIRLLLESLPYGLKLDYMPS